MSTLLIVVGVTLGGYLLGSISFSRVVVGAVDPETDLGSLTMEWGDGVGFDVENVSATAVASSAGAMSGCLTAVLDILKGFVPTLVLRLLFPSDIWHLAAGVGVLAGHNFPVFHRFKGGRGVSPSIGMLLAVAPPSIPITIVVSEIVGLFVFRDVLLAHMGWYILLPVYFALTGGWPELVVWSLALNGLRWFTARSDVRQYLALKRAGELRTEAFHDMIEQTHMGYFHKYARKYGLLKYCYPATD